MFFVAFFFVLFFLFYHAFSLLSIGLITRVQDNGTARDSTNALGEYGENPASDIAVNDISKVWYRTSLLGTALYAVDKEGNTVAHAIYDAWGLPLTETAVDMNFSGLERFTNYTGYTWDETLGLYYAQNRFYDAETHRFTQSDPIEDGTNWYSYCENNPLTNTDAYGFGLAGAIKDAFVKAKTVVTKAAQKFTDAAKKAAQVITQTAQKVATKVAETVQKTVTKVAETVQKTATKVAETVKATVTNVAATVKDTASSVSAAVCLTRQLRT